MNIDYRIIADAIDHYRAVGYRQVEVPWMVDRAVVAQTFLGRGFGVDDGRVLVGSAEQGFIASPHRGKLMACSPCFRPDTIDEFHQEQFVKLELYNDVETSDADLQSMIREARSFFARHGEAKIEETVEGWDITIAGIEVGSYGRRRHDDTTWLYGTGVALPRLSIAQLWL
jgi:hypothetical protein